MINSQQEAWDLFKEKFLKLEPGTGKSTCNLQLPPVQPPLLDPST
jgi:hypothetical protein